jgi:predicted phosphodiesterase
MRVFAVSDLHIDYEANGRWARSLSSADYLDDVLIIAGDITDKRNLLEWCLTTLSKRFKRVLFVPGNHELWVIREGGGKDSLQKFYEVFETVESSGASMHAFCDGEVSIIPLLGWYDYSFGEPSEELRSRWMDYRTCRWPTGLTEKDIVAYFATFNNRQVRSTAETVITYSHFLPRIDLMPSFAPRAARVLYPILGSAQLELQLRTFTPKIHVYGHSHLNCQTTIDGVSYINNAFGYPSETTITSKRLKCIHES